MENTQLSNLIPQFFSEINNFFFYFVAALFDQNITFLIFPSQVQPSSDLNQTAHSNLVPASVNITCKQFGNYKMQRINKILYAEIQFCVISPNLAHPVIFGTSRSRFSLSVQRLFMSGRHSWSPEHSLCDLWGIYPD